jgi:hypothetical protein
VGQAGAQRPASTPRLSAATGTDGKFVISDVPAGDYRLYATHPNGYVPAEYGQRSVTGLGLPITLTAGQKMSGIVMGMTQTASISGRVTDADGDTAAFVSILAFRIAYRPGGERKVEIVQSVLTDDRGEFRIFWLAPGKYYLSAMPIEPRRYGLPLSFAGRFGGAQYLATPMLGYRTLDNGEIVEETWAPIYYPGTTDIRTARQISLAGGEQFNAAMSVANSPTRTLQIRGVVLNPGGQPVANAQVDLSPKKSDGHSVVLPTASTDGKGAFTIHGVVAGNYVMTVTAGLDDRVLRVGPIGVDPGSASPPLTAALPLDVGAGGVPDLTIRAVPAVNIPWQATLEGGDGNATLNLNVTLTRDPIITSFQGPAPPSLMATGPARPKVLQNVGAGDYKVVVSGLPKNAFVRSIRMGSQDVLKDGLHVTGSAPDPLEIVIGAKGGSVDGVVRAGRDRVVSSATVVLLPELSQRQTRLDLFKDTTSGADGKFHFDGITPGTYRIFAWEDIRSGDWYDADFMKTQEFNGVEIRFNESDSKELDVPVIPVERSGQ